MPQHLPRHQPEDGPASRAGLRALDRLINAYGPEALLAAPMAPGPAAGLREAVRLLCAEARREDPRRAERLVIALHAAWPRLPAVQRLPAGDGRDAVLARVIAECIAEFYAAGGYGGDSAVGAAGGSDAD
jgi:hypothetical protein